MEEGYSSQIEIIGAKLIGTKVQSNEDVLLYCELCDYRCKRKLTMKKHMNTKHSKEREICKECKEEFKSAIELLKHISEHHHIKEQNSIVDKNTEDPDQNITCGKKFSTNLMKVHIETKHC